jgi:hypothetical protein
MKQVVSEQHRQATEVIATQIGAAPPIPRQGLGMKLDPRDPPKPIREPGDDSPPDPDEEDEDDLEDEGDPDENAEPSPPVSPRRV